MCVICTEPLDALIKLTSLDCSGCRDLVAIPNELVQLKALSCSGCPRLRHIPPTLVELRTLWCIGCPRLTAIPPTLAELTELMCSRCPLLASIPSELVNLETLVCAYCPLLRVIPDALVQLTDLCCSGCPLLVSIPAAFARSASLPCSRWHLVPYTPHPILPRRVECIGCPWLPQSAASHPDHGPSLLRLQRWFHTGKKQTFKRFVRTRAFNEWIFHPDQIGGKLVKRQLESELGAMRPAKKQRVE